MSLCDVLGVFPKSKMDIENELKPHLHRMTRCLVVTSFAPDEAGVSFHAAAVVQRQT